MRKVLSVLAIFGLIMSLGIFVSADTVQTVTGTVGDYVEVTVTPTLDFGAIPYGTNVTHPGTDVVIDATNADTASGTVNVDMLIGGADEAFFTPLIEFDESENPEVINWVKVASMGTVVVGEGSIITYHSQLNGDTTLQGAGAKSATITYTITATP